MTGLESGRATALSLTITSEFDHQLTQPPIESTWFQQWMLALCIQL